MSGSAKIKVLHVIRPAEGGMREHLKSLLLNLNRDKYQLAVAGPVDEELAKLALQSGISVIRLDIRGEIAPVCDLKSALKLRSVMRRVRPDIVHAHGSKAGLLARVACLLWQPHRLIFPRLSKPEILITLHNLVYTGSVNRPKLRLLQSAERLLAGLVSRFITVSNTLRDEILAYQGVDREKVVTIYNGLDLQAFRRVERPQPDLPKTVVIGTVARLAPQKGIHYFIRMASLLALRNQDLTFMIVGDGPLRTELEELAAGLPGKPRITFIGSVSQVQAYLEAMDIFVLPSVSEGLGISVLEAMAMHKPVLATRVGGLPEIVQHQVNGLLVPPENPAALAAAVEWLVQHPNQAAELARAGYFTVKTKFALETMIRETEEVYEQILQDAPGGILNWQPR